VRNVEDILKLRKIVNNKNKLTKIVAKIEKPEAVDGIDAIIEASDALMVARGDLGVEIPMEKVPLLQKTLVNKCNYAGKPVIVATQMLESMVQNPRPTRAEASDVANAILDGADAIMLSAETAAGAYPSLAVRSMARIIKAVEKESPRIFNKHHNIDDHAESFLNDRLLATACMLSGETDAKVITGMTLTGFTAFGISKHRPTAGIYIFTGNRQLLTQLALVWGVRAIYYEKFESTDDSINDIQNILVERGILNKNDVYVTTGTIPVSSRKRTNAIRINTVD
jgi:pyruvate kinase